MCIRDRLPGILSLFVVSLLFMFNEVRMAGVACLLMCGGMYALAVCGAGTSLWTLSAWILTVSLGQHILMGMIDTIVIHTARPEKDVYKRQMLSSRRAAYRPQMHASAPHVAFWRRERRLQ